MVREITKYMGCHRRQGGRTLTDQEIARKKERAKCVDQATSSQSFAARDVVAVSFAALAQDDGHPSSMDGRLESVQIVRQLVVVMPVTGAVEIVVAWLVVKVITMPIQLSGMVVVVRCAMPRVRRLSIAAIPITTVVAVPLSTISVSTADIDRRFANGNAEAAATNDAITLVACGGTLNRKVECLDARHTVVS